MRKALLGPEQPRFACRAYRGLIPAEKVADFPRESTAWLGPGRHLVHYFVSAGKLLNFVGHVEQEAWISESWTEPGSVDDLRAAYAGWHPQVQRLIDAVDETFIWAVMDRTPIDQWTYGRVTMLGDACHPMLPFMGQGGAQAIEDAVALDRLPAKVRRRRRIRASNSMNRSVCPAPTGSRPSPGTTKPGSTCPTARTRRRATRPWREG